MRYGQPAIGERLAALQAAGCDRILLAPLYPQYCAATSATVCDKAFDALQDDALAADAARRRRLTSTIPPISARVAQSIRAGLAALDFEPEVILASFHGIPRAYFDKGDPYYCHCAKTWRLLREALGLSPERLQLTFQSRFGPSECLQPYTDETVKALAARGVKRLAIVTPGFAADCLETLEEIGVENAGYFRDGGGEKFAAIPCLNDSAEGVRVILNLVQRELVGLAVKARRPLINCAGAGLYRGRFAPVLTGRQEVRTTDE